MNGVQLYSIQVSAWHCLSNPISQKIICYACQTHICTFASLQHRLLRLSPVVVINMYLASFLNSKTCYSQVGMLPDIASLLTTYIWQIVHSQAYPLKSSDGRKLCNQYLQTATKKQTGTRNKRNCYWDSNLSVFSKEHTNGMSSCFPINTYELIFNLKAQL